MGRVGEQSKQTALNIDHREEVGMIRAILAAISLALILIAITLPWLTFTIVGQLAFSPIDMIRAFVNRDNQISPGTYDVNQLASSYTDTYVSLILSMILYPLSIAFMIAALVVRGHSRHLLGAGGFFAVVSSISWFYAIESVKSHAIAESSTSGGFGQAIGTAFASAIGIGSGPYLVIAAGIIGMAGYFIKDSFLSRGAIVRES